MEFKEVVSTRRAVNFFDPGKKVDEKTLREIFELASLAPTSFNLQPFKIILVGDPANKEKLKTCAFGQPKVTQASHVLIMLGDKKAYLKMDPVLDDFVSKGYYPAEAKDGIKSMASNLYSGDNERAFASRNTGLFAMNFMLSARSLEVDTHPMDGFDATAVKTAFNVPEDYDVVMLIAVGYFDTGQILKERPARKTFDEVVVREGF